jgi:hypothetical protein
MFYAEKLSGTFVNIFDFQQYYPKDLKNQRQKVGQPSAYILPKFCQGFNFDIKFEELEGTPKTPEDHSPAG